MDSIYRYRIKINTVQIVITITVAGSDFLQYSPHPTGCPDFAATEVPTTFAEAPIGVALPPMSVHIERLHASVSSGTPVETESACTTGIIVAANGMLSIKALAIAEPQTMIAIIR